MRKSLATLSQVAAIWVVAAIGCASPTAAAAVENQTTTVKAGYSNVNNQLSASGNFGNPIGLILGTSNFNVTGSVDQNSTANGVGNATGGASFSVAPMPDSKDTAQSGITVSASGTVGVTASGSGQSPGYVEVKGTSYVKFTETATG